MGPSLMIATCLILAIRTAKWSSTWDPLTGDASLDTEIEYAAHLAGRVMATLCSRHEALFPQRKEPWYKANDESVPK